MNSYRIVLGSATGYFVLVLSLTFLLIQLYGLLRPPIGFSLPGSLPGFNVQVLPTSQVVDLLHEPANEPGIDWLKDVNMAVYLALPHGGASKLRFEHNWVLWALSKWKGDGLRYTQDPMRIVASGSAICSQSARVVAAIAEINEVAARLISFEGHVIAEVKIDGAWFAVDPDYGVFFPFGAEALTKKDNQGIIEAGLAANGFSERATEKYIAIVRNGVSVRHGIWEPHEPKPWLIEAWTSRLSWGLPVVGILAGLVLIFLRRKTRVFN